MVNSVLVLVMCFWMRRTSATRAFRGHCDGLALIWKAETIVKGTKSLWGAQRHERQLIRRVITLCLCLNKCVF